MEVIFWFWSIVLTFDSGSWNTLRPSDFSFAIFVKIFKNNLCLTQILEYFQELYIIKKFLVICGEIECKNNFRSWLETKRFIQPKTIEMTKKLYILFFVFIKPLMVSHSWCNRQITKISILRVINVKPHRTMVLAKNNTLNPIISKHCLPVSFIVNF